MRSVPSNKTKELATTYTGGKTDVKGRVEGIIIEEWEVEMVPLPEGEVIGYDVEPGTYFMARMTKTKNGQKFGATQPSQYFKTHEERHAAVVKRLAKVLK